MLVKKHLDALQDGVKLLNVFDAELTDDAIRAVRDAARRPRATRSPSSARSRRSMARRRRRRQRIEDAARARSTLARDRRDRRPTWRRSAPRTSPSGAAAPVAGAARRAGARPGEGSRRVRHAHGRPGAQGAPPVQRRRSRARPPRPSPRRSTLLKDPFEVALKRAEDEANERLDEILSEGERPLIVKVDLGIRNREVATEAEVESLVDEIRERLLEQVRAGQRVRIV